MLPAATLLPNPSELLESPAVDVVIDTPTTHFDFVCPTIQVRPAAGRRSEREEDSRAILMGKTTKQVHGEARSFKTTGATFLVSW